MSTKYIHFTAEQKEQARLTDIADLLRRQGEVLKKSGSELVWRDGSEKVTVRGNLFFHQYEGSGGDAIDFVRKYYNLDYPEAVNYLLNGSSATLTRVDSTPQKPSEPFELPPRNDNMRRVYAYLHIQRGINREVLNTFIHSKMIYESAEFHNAVFVGYDRNGVPRHAHKRGSGSESQFKCNQSGSTPEHSFHWHGRSDRLYLFEAPIDMLSYISLHSDGWQKHSYAASCGVSEHVMWQMMKDNPNIHTVYLCRDNDLKGQEANKRTTDALFIKGIKSEILIPNHKDWNEDLLFPIESEESECQEQQLL